MPVGVKRPGLLTRLIKWVTSAFQAGPPPVHASKPAGELPALFIPRLAADRAALTPSPLASVIDFAATLKTYALAARLRSVATQNVRCSLKGRGRRRAAAAGKPIPKPAPRVLKRYTSARAPVAPTRRFGMGPAIRPAQVCTLPEAFGAPMLRQAA
jgi:hypothetical protein